ncbi:MAG: trypsin-like peptidase domain-containing protein [Actinobacteria bacterium]|nr:trypsin-like peptidase domain-containing protein [Actinomycetota bacterium]
MESITSTYHNGPALPPDGGGSGKHSFLSAVVGGAVVAAVFAVLTILGVIGGETRTVVQQGVSGTTTVSDDELLTVNEIYRKTSPGVVSIKTRVNAGGSDNIFGVQQEGLASGTGVVIDKKGFIVTNAHVVENNTASPTVQFNDEKSVTAKVVGRDPSNDIAVLKIDPKGLKLEPVPLGKSSKLEVGSPVVAIGSPFGLDQTVTTGIVSGLQREITAPNQFTIGNVIQTDAAINPGNSGGPLLDAAGRMIGMNSQIATSGNSEGNVGIGFAVPIDTIRKILPELEKSGKIDYAYLGISTLGLTPEIAGKLNVGGSKSGALVQCVVNGGPAEKAGFRAGSDSAVINGQETKIGGDLIVKIDGKEVKSSEDVAALIVTKKPGQETIVTVIRDGKSKDLKTKLSSRPTKAVQNNCSR